MTIALWLGAVILGASIISMMIWGQFPWLYIVCLATAQTLLSIVVLYFLITTKWKSSPASLSLS